MRLMPSAWATSSSSRIAIHARPSRDSSAPGDVGGNDRRNECEIEERHRRGKGKIADRWPRDLQNAFGSGKQRGGGVGKHDDPDDLTETQRSHRQIVAPYLEYWNAENYPDDYGSK